MGAVARDNSSEPSAPRQRNSRWGKRCWCSRPTQGAEPAHPCVAPGWQPSGKAKLSGNQQSSCPLENGCGCRPALLELPQRWDPHQDAIAFTQGPLIGSKRPSPWPPRRRKTEPDGATNPGVRSAEWAKCSVESCSISASADSRSATPPARCPPPARPNQMGMAQHMEATRGPAGARIAENAGEPLLQLRQEGAEASGARRETPRAKASAASTPPGSSMPWARSTRLWIKAPSSKRGARRSSSCKGSSHQEAGKASGRRCQRSP